MKNVSFNFGETHPLHLIGLLTIMLICGLMPMHAGVVADAHIGDTLQCPMRYKGHSLYDDFLHSGRGITFVRKQSTIAPFYAIIREKNDSVALMTLNIRGAGGVDRRVAEISYLITTPDTIKRFGTWDWYDENGSLIYRESYAHDKQQGIEKYIHDTINHVTIGEYYMVLRKPNGRSTIRHNQTNVYSLAGYLTAVGHIPSERTQNNSRGVKTLTPSTAIYMDEQGNRINYDNTKQVEQAVQKFIQKNFKSPKVENSFVAEAAFDVIVKTEKDGKITVLYADSENIYYIYTMLSGPAHGEFNAKMIPHLKNYLTNDLPSLQLKGKPVLSDKQPVESILYFTVKIVLNTSW